MLIVDWKNDCTKPYLLISGETPDINAFLQIAKAQFEQIPVSVKSLRSRSSIVVQTTQRALSTIRTTLAIWREIERSRVAAMEVSA